MSHGNLVSGSDLISSDLMRIVLAVVWMIALGRNPQGNETSLSPIDGLQSGPQQMSLGKCYA